MPSRTKKRRTQSAINAPDRRVCCAAILEFSASGAARGKRSPDAALRPSAFAGVPVELRKYDGMIHGFFTLGAAFSQAVRALREGATALRQAVGG